jgi:hypothetical protein
MLNQHRNRAILHQRGLRIADCIPERHIAHAHANSETLASDPGLNNLKLRPVANVPFRNRRKFHENIAASCREVIQGPFDFVVGVHPDPSCRMLSDEFVSNRLARVPLLHAYDKALEIPDPMHVWMTARIDDQRLARNRIGRAEVPRRVRGRG